MVSLLRIFRLSVLGWCCFKQPRVGCVSPLLWEVGSGTRYLICVIQFTRCASVVFSHCHGEWFWHGCGFFDSRGVLQNLIPLATAYWEVCLNLNALCSAASATLWCYLVLQPDLAFGRAAWGSLADFWSWCKGSCLAIMMQNACWARASSLEAQWQNLEWPSEAMEVPALWTVLVWIRADGQINSVLDWLTHQPDSGQHCAVTGCVLIFQGLRPDY